MSNAQLAMNDLSGIRAEVPQAQADATAATASIKVVYIAGDGRSGSTLLDRLIGTYPGVFSCGELGNLLMSLTSPDQLCACGSRAQDCSFWAGVGARWSAAVPDFTEREYLMLQRRYERLRSLLRRAPEFNLSNPRFARYAEYTGALFRAIAAASGTRVIVDSSKSPARALALSRVPGLEVCMLHLVRDVRGVAYSLRKLRNGTLRPARASNSLRYVGTWAAVNYFCEKVRPQMQRPSLLTRYEDYTADPDGLLAAVAEMLGMERVPFESRVDRLMEQGHQVAGNDARFKPVKRIATDDTWRRQLGFSMQKGLYLLALPLMLRYGYRP